MTDSRTAGLWRAVRAGEHGAIAPLLRQLAREGGLCGCELLLTPRLPGGRPLLGFGEWRRILHSDGAWWLLNGKGLAVAGPLDAGELATLADNCCLGFRSTEEATTAREREAAIAKAAGAVERAKARLHNARTAWGRRAKNGLPPSVAQAARVTAAQVELRRARQALEALDP